MGSGPILSDLQAAGLIPQLDDHARSTYPEECCGLIVRDGGTLRAIPCDNLQNEMHAKYPEDFTRTAATAYYIDPKHILEHQDQLCCIYHSHPDHGAYFSEEDQLVAAPFGEPNFPGVTYLVLSVMGGELADRQVFAWCDTEEKFTSSPHD